MKKSLKADLALLFLSFVWGATFGLVKDALKDASPLLFTSVRFFIAVFVFWVIFRKSIIKINRKLLTAGIIAGTFMALGYAFQTVGLYYTTASKSAFITGFSVILVPFFTIFIEKVVPRKIIFISAAITLIGLKILTSAGSNNGINIGDILTLFCAASFGLNLICIEIYTKKYDFATFAFIQIVTVAVVCGLAVPVFEVPRFSFTPTLIWALLITAVFCSALAIYILNRVQRFTTASHAAIIFTMEPVFAYLTAFIFYGERLGFAGTAGAVLILTGMLLSELKR